MLVIVDPDVFLNKTPHAKLPALALPEPNEPIALSDEEVEPKLYAFPEVNEPVPAAYVVPVPVLCQYQLDIVELSDQEATDELELKVLKS
jgi:hypothetical protein